ncbi:MULTISPECIES: LuxR C-terminal-related transcriptional regulator [unclassified Frankia]|uniref:LuxR C-terminal-related transcriptional regulator n=1 Tax=unclassified Frankia TaxID=2632575 RepID=UPI002025693E
MALHTAVDAAPVEPGSRSAAALTARLERIDGESIDAAVRGGEAARAGALLAELGAVQNDLRAHMFGMPFRVLSRIREELARIRRATTSAEAIASAPAALCAAGGFDRAMISSLRGSTWLPAELHVTTDADSAVNVAFRDFIQDLRIPLTSAMPEAELVRRKVPALIQQAQSEPRLFRPLVEVSQTREYVVAPVLASGSVVGYLHADTYSSGRRLTGYDRERIQIFADGFGLILERTVLLERLALQRERIAKAFCTARMMTEGLSAAPVRLARQSIPATESKPPVSLPGMLAASAPRLPDGLTPREREVLALLASGATNAQIADRLTVSETTVKSHVKHILRKLRASNRAEAIARYLYLARSQDRAL